MQRVAIIALGALGDVCAVLPIALHEFRQGNNVTFIIAREFASLLDGVTYVEPQIYDGNYSECLKAAEQAEQSGRFDKVMVCQVYGTSIDRQTDSFVKEAWRAVGKLHLWGKLPLVFDNRDRNREAELLVKIGRREKPMVLVATEGRSSPFPHSKELISILEPLRDRFDFINLDGFKAEQFYDLLGLMEEATCLIATDSGTVHLANATPDLPVIALVTDRPDHWHGCPPQPNHILRIRYGDFQKSKERIVDTLNQLVTKQKVERRIIHCWNDYPYRQQDAQYRHSIAKASWEQEYKKGRWLPCPIYDAQLTRNANSVGEPKPLPFVNDIINLACEQAQPDDLICLTNDDTIFVDDLTERLLNTPPPFWSSRWEHTKVGGPLNAESIKKNSRKHVGADVFVFTKRWWLENGGEFPDFILAREQWDLILKHLINIRGGHEEDALCAHIIHQPEWYSPEYRESVGNLFNRESGAKFVREHNLRWPLA